MVRPIHFTGRSTWLANIVAATVDIEALNLITTELPEREATLLTVEPQEEETQAQVEETLPQQRSPSVEATEVIPPSTKCWRLARRVVDVSCFTYLCIGDYVALSLAIFPNFFLYNHCRLPQTTMWVLPTMWPTVQLGEFTLPSVFSKKQKWWSKHLFPPRIPYDGCGSGSLSRLIALPGRYGFRRSPGSNGQGLCIGCS